MDQQTWIAEIEERARDRGISITSICKKAGVHPTTFFRGKKSRGNPSPTSMTMGNAQKIESALDALIAQRDRARKAVAA